MPSYSEIKHILHKTRNNRVKRSRECGGCEAGNPRCRGGTYFVKRKVRCGDSACGLWCSVWNAGRKRPALRTYWPIVYTRNEFLCLQRHMRELCHGNYKIEWKVYINEINARHKENKLYTFWEASGFMTAGCFWFWFLNSPNDDDADAPLTQIGLIDGLSSGCVIYMTYDF